MIKSLTRFGLMAVAALLVFSCTSPFNPGSGDVFELLGILRINSISPQGGVSASTVFPDFDENDVVEFEVEIHNGPGSAAGQSVTVAASNGDLAEPVEFRDLVPGDWTVTVTAYGAGNVVLLVGSSSVSVSAGAVTAVDAVSLQLTEGAGNGAWELELRWPADNTEDYPLTDVVTEVVYSVDGGATWNTAAAPTLDGTDRVVTLSGADVAPGSFFLTVRLNSDKPEPYATVARYDELWYVASNLTTRKQVTLAPEDFSYGGGAGITITIDTPEDLAAFFDGLGPVPSTVVTGSTFTITADAGIGASAYSWRLNGVNTGVTDDTFVLGSPQTDADKVGVVYTITLEVTVDGMNYSGSHRVRIEPAP